MAQQIPVGAQALARGVDDGAAREVAPDVASLRLGLSNVALIGEPDSERWVLIDAGLPGVADKIKAAAERRFARTHPQAIWLTHGHVDHVGALVTLARDWNVPIYAHLLEHPYLNGACAYPKPDATVGGGVFSLISPLFPRGPIDVSAWLRALPEDGTTPGLPGWTWIATPGHAPGHVSFWRESDRSLIAGDAFITTAQESAYSVVT